jgi:hypothetical protein
LRPRRGSVTSAPCVRAAAIDGRAEPRDDPATPGHHAASAISQGSGLLQADLSYSEIPSQ